MKRVEGSEGEGEGDDIATNSRGSRNDGPRMDKLCTLLLPSLRQPQGGTGAPARVIWTYCDGEHPGHQMFSRGPWPEYRHAPLGRNQMFRQSTEDSILSIMMGCSGRSNAFEVVVRYATLLAYADGARVVLTATAAVATDQELSNGDGDGQLAPVQAVMEDVNIDNDVGGGVDDGVPWDAWGPRATTADEAHGGWCYVLGERRAAIEQGADQICIRDYNPYRIRRARASMVAKDLGGRGWVDPHEEEGNAYTFRPRVIRKITEMGEISGGDLFQGDVTTGLPYLDTVVDVPGCRAIYMEQDHILLHVDDLDQVSWICCCGLLTMGWIAFG
jgi:hypothetical protein